jgi:RNA polymerase sigma factor (sigma-70 family)
VTRSGPGQSIPDPGRDVERWYGEYHTRLLQFLRRNLRTETDAQDVSQEVFLRLLRIPEDRVVEHPRAYLFRVAVNVLNDWRADQRMFETRPPDDFDKLETTRETEEDYDARKRLEAIDRALRSLPRHYRATIVLKTRDGLSYKEIASHLGVSERMVKRYVVKGYARLREKLPGSAAGPDFA